MPPKPKFSREEIILAAYEVARESGIDAVVARTVGKKLNSTSTPIFTFFSGMEELKREVYCRAKAECMAYLRDSVQYFPAFKEFGLRWIHYAVREPHLFKLLFTDDRYAQNPDDPMQEFGDVTASVLESIKWGFGLSAEDAGELFYQMILHANGIAAFSVNHPDHLDEAKVSRLISETCIGLVTVIKLRDGSFDPEAAKRMAAAADTLPQRIDSARGKP